MALLFAATYPERVAALVLWATFARLAWAPDYPQGVDRLQGERVLRPDRAGWGRGLVWPLISTHDAPDDEATRRLLATMERNSSDAGDGGGCQPFCDAH